MRERIYEIFSKAAHPLRALWYWGTRPKTWRSRLIRFQALQDWANRRAHYHANHGHEKRAREWFDHAESYRRKWKKIRRQHAPTTDVVVEAGSPHWGGSDDILEHEVEPIAARIGVLVTSAKRVDTLGNPSSDHYVGNTTASARDFGTADNFALRDRIMHELGVDGSISDYGNYYIQRAGRKYRVQPIAGTHGTGPHLHIGVRLI